MIQTALRNTFSKLIHTPLLWISGVYAGLIMTSVIWLEFSDGMFLAGKIAMLSLIAAPFLVGMMNFNLQTGEKSLREILSAGLKNYFPIVLPCITLAGMMFILMLLLSIPLSIMGFGGDPYTLTGLTIGIVIPALIFSLYIDNVAVCEKRNIFGTLKRSLELVSMNFFGAIGYYIISAFFILGVSLFGAFLWGIILADKFTPFIEMNMTVQQETFSHYTLVDWQNLIGPEGSLVTAIVFGIVSCIVVPFLIVFKYQCYLELSQQTIVEYGEFDEKGRWYKY